MSEQTRTEKVMGEKVLWVMALGGLAGLFIYYVILRGQP